MSTLSKQRIAELLEPYFAAAVPASEGPGGALQTPLDELVPKVSVYLELLARWNARTNLTAVRDPETAVRRHFGESFFAARVLAGRVSDGSTVLDFGSGAGFPGVPIQLLLPNVRVTLAESQKKKAAFLREAVRTLGLQAEVWAGRVEDLPVNLLFQAVVMRAVDDSAVARRAAGARVGKGGWLLEFVPRQTVADGAVPIPGSTGGALHVRNVGA